MRPRRAAARVRPAALSTPLFGAGAARGARGCPRDVIYNFGIAKSFGQCARTEFGIEFRDSPARPATARVFTARVFNAPRPRGALAPPNRCPALG